MFLPKDGQTNPVDTTLAFAKGARQRGAADPRRRARSCASWSSRAGRSGVHDRAGRGAGRDRRAGGRHVVARAGGCGRRQRAAARGRALLHRDRADARACRRDLPSLRVTDECTYYKEDAGKLLLGCFEPVAKPWGMDGIPEDFCFDSPARGRRPFRADPRAGACTALPALREAGIQTFFNGPESFTPDDRYLLGETAELRDLFVACGFNSIGIQSSGGAGKVLAEWIRDRRPPVDLTDVDVRRLHPVPEQPAATCATARPRRWACSTRCTGPTASSPPPAAPAARPSTTGWWPPVPSWARRPAGSGRTGTRRAGVGAGVPLLLRPPELVRAFVPRSAGPCATRVGPLRPVELRQVPGRRAPTPAPSSSASRPTDVDVPAGRIVYTQWLNERGGIEADLTVTRLDETSFLVVTGAASADPRPRVAPPARSRPTHAAAVVDVTSGLPMLGLMGPRSRDLLQALTGEDLSNAAFPFGTSREVEIGYARVRASRITYVGELGWELYVPAEFALHVFERVIEAGAEFGLGLAGYHAMGTLPHREGLPPLGPRHRPRGHAARGGPGLRRRLGQARRLHRPRRAPAAARARLARAPPRPGPPRRRQPPPLPRGADLA